MHKSWMPYIVTFAVGVSAGLAVGYSKPQNATTERTASIPFSEPILLEETDPNGKITLHKLLPFAVVRQDSRERFAEIPDHEQTWTIHFEGRTKILYREVPMN